jgi:hypothetical protein
MALRQGRGVMSKPFDVDKVAEALRSAFGPLDCGVEVFDFEQKLRFRIFDANGKAVLRVRQMLTEGLRSAIKEVRNRLKAKGFELKPWERPR